jgi:hypothetical protein
MTRTCVLMLSFACTVLWTHPSAADGALAVGLPKDVAKQGFAYGYSNNYSAKDAGDAAIKQCIKSGVSAPQALQLCKVIETYSNKCVAVAMDPAPGTPGVGWAIAADLHTAESNALAKCEATAGPGRRAACKIDKWDCDGTAK